MPTVFSVGGPIARVKSKLAGIASPNLAPLMTSFMKIIADDNRKGVLKGTDKRGHPMDKVTYRPRGRARATTAAQRGGYRGFGMHAAGLHNNLTTREYEQLGGPPLAPRRQHSRVITNLKTGFQKVGISLWEAYGYWDHVVSTRGVPFLHAHFTGARTGRRGRTRLPQRDLRGVRPEGRTLARKAARNYFRDLTRGTKTIG